MQIRKRDGEEHDRSPGVGGMTFLLSVIHAFFSCCVARRNGAVMSPQSKSGLVLGRRMYMSPASSFRTN